MAAVVRLGCGRLVKRYFSTLVNQPSINTFGNKHRLCFHTSQFLNVLGQEINMPSLSPTMTSGTIVQWLKKEGDTVVPGDVLCEIQTDKAVMAFETEEEGILAKILVQSGKEEIKVGTLIALMVAEGEDWKSVEVAAAAGGSGSSSSSSSPSPPAGSGSGAASGSGGGGKVPGTPVKMPALSPTMTEGTIVKWLKKEGEKISPGDALCEIQTDKAVMTMEMDDEGVLAKILTQANSVVKVGTLIAVTVEEGQDWKSVAIPADAQTPASAPPAGPVPAAGPTGGKTPGTQVKMPALSPTMTEGVIVKWLKKEGAKLAPGDVLCEIQTDKAVMSFEVDEEAILAKILVPDGTKATVGQLIAMTVAEGDDWKDVQIPAPEAPAGVPAAVPAGLPVSTAAAATAPAAPAEPHHQLYGLFGPAVRALLEQYRLSGKEVKPTGRHNRILKADVLGYVAEKSLQKQPPQSVPPPGAKSGPAGAAAQGMHVPASVRAKTGFTDVEISSMRMTIAKRLTQSKTEIPHSYMTLEAQIDSIAGARKELKNVGVSVSVNDFVIKGVAHALRQCPFVNKLYKGNTIVSAPGIDISVAVATPNGLITPIVKAANTKSIDTISAEIKELAKRARANKLQLHEFQGGSFTISNLGMFGITEFSAIINPPQIAILAVGGGRSIVTVNGKAATVMRATLSYDARALSEGDAAAFMEVLQGYLENASVLLAPDHLRPVVNTKVSTEAAYI